MNVKTPNTYFKYDDDDSIFYLYVRNSLGDYQRVEAFEPSQHGQVPNYYIFDDAIPSGKTFSGGDISNTYLIKSSLDQHTTISNEGALIIFDTDVEVSVVTSSDAGITVLTANTVLITISSNTAQFIVKGAAAISASDFVNDYGSGFVAVPTAFSIDENADGSVTPVTVGSVAGLDANNLATYSLGAGATDFNIADGTDVITYTGSGFDADAGDDSITLTVVASHGDTSTEHLVVVTINDLNDIAPIGFDIPGSVTIGQDAAIGDVVLTLPQAIGDVDGVPVIYSMGGEVNNFTFDSASHELKVNAALAANATYNLTFTAATTVGDTTKTSTQIVAVRTIAASSSNLTFDDNASATEFNIIESDSNVIVSAAATTDAAGGVVNYTLTSGGAYFKIDTSGNISLRDDFEFDALPEDVTMPLTVDFEASDGVSTINRTIYVTVTDANENMPFLDNPEIIVDEDFGGDVTLTAEHLNYTDADNSAADAAAIVYTIEGLADGTIVKKIDTVDETTTVLDPTDTFTQADVIAGDVVLSINQSQVLTGLSLSVNDGTHSSDNHDITISTRTDLYIADTDASNTVDLSY